MLQYVWALKKQTQYIFQNKIAGATFYIVYTPLYTLGEKDIDPPHWQSLCGNSNWSHKPENSFESACCTTAETPCTETKCK